MDRRIYGLETEYGVACTSGGAAPADPGRGRPLPVPPGGHLGPVLERLPAQRIPDLPRRRVAPGVRDRGVRRPGPADQPRPGRRADPRGPDHRRRAAAGQRGDQRRHLPVQEQHRQPRQLLRLPRELPDLPDRRLLQDHRRAGAVPGVAAADLRRRQGAAHRARRGVQRQPAGRAHLGVGVLGHHPQPADHQHPRRAARRPGALPPAARDRRRLQHERDHHAAQGGQRGAGAAADRGRGADARPHPGEPDPGHPGHEPRPRPAGSRWRCPTAGGSRRWSCRPSTTRRSASSSAGRAWAPGPSTGCSTCGSGRCGRWRRTSWPWSTPRSTGRSSRSCWTGTRPSTP